MQDSLAVPQKIKHSHACNLSYSEGRDQEACHPKPAPGKTTRPSLKTIQHKKRASRVAQGLVPEFKPQYQKKKKI
jgi:hypothetical protein